MSRIKSTLLEEQYIYWSCLIEYFLEWEIFQTNVVQKMKIHFLSFNFFQKSCGFRNNVQNSVQPDTPQCALDAAELT